MAMTLVLRGPTRELFPIPRGKTMERSEQRNTGGREGTTQGSGPAVGAGDSFIE